MLSASSAMSTYLALAPWYPFRLKDVRISMRVEWRRGREIPNRCECPGEVMTKLQRTPTTRPPRHLGVIGVWGAVFGALLLLARRRLAVGVFLASLMGVVVTSFHNYILSNGMDVSGDPISLGFAAVIFLVALGLFLYARSMRRRGVLV